MGNRPLWVALWLAFTVLLGAVPQSQLPTSRAACVEALDGPTSLATEPRSVDDGSHEASTGDATPPPQTPISEFGAPCNSDLLHAFAEAIDSSTRLASHGPRGPPLA